MYELLEFHNEDVRAKLYAVALTLSPSNPVMAADDFNIETLVNVQDKMNPRIDVHADDEYLPSVSEAIVKGVLPLATLSIETISKVMDDLIRLYVNWLRGGTVPQSIGCCLYTHRECLVYMSKMLGVGDLLKYSVKDHDGTVIPISPESPFNNVSALDPTSVEWKYLFLLYSFVVCLLKTVGSGFAFVHQVHAYSEHDFFHFLFDFDVLAATNVRDIQEQVLRSFSVVKDLRATSSEQSEECSLWTSILSRLQFMATNLVMTELIHPSEITEDRDFECSCGVEASGEDLLLLLLRGDLSRFTIPLEDASSRPAQLPAELIRRLAHFASATLDTFAHKSLIRDIKASTEENLEQQFMRLGIKDSVPQIPFSAPGFHKKYHRFFIFRQKPRNIIDYDWYQSIEYMKKTLVGLTFASEMRALSTYSAHLSLTSSRDGPFQLSAGLGSFPVFTPVACGTLVNPKDPDAPSTQHKGGMNLSKARIEHLLRLQDCMQDPSQLFPEVLPAPMYYPPIEEPYFPTSFATPYFVSESHVEQLMRNLRCIKCYKHHLVVDTTATGSPKVQSGRVTNSSDRLFHCIDTLFELLSTFSEREYPIFVRSYLFVLLFCGSASESTSKSDAQLALYFINKSQHIRDEINDAFASNSQNKTFPIEIESVSMSDQSSEPIDIAFRPVLDASQNVELETTRFNATANMQLLKYKEKQGQSLHASTLRVFGSHSIFELVAQSMLQSGISREVLGSEEGRMFISSFARAYYRLLIHYFKYRGAIRQDMRHSISDFEKVRLNADYVDDLFEKYINSRVNAFAAYEKSTSVISVTSNRPIDVNLSLLCDMSNYITNHMPHDLPLLLALQEYVKVSRLIHFVDLWMLRVQKQHLSLAWEFSLTNSCDWLPFFRHSHTLSTHYLVVSKKINDSIEVTRKYPQLSSETLESYLLRTLFPSVGAISIQKTESPGLIPLTNKKSESNMQSKKGKKKTKSAATAISAKTTASTADCFFGTDQGRMFKKVLEVLNKTLSTLANQPVSALDTPCLFTKFHSIEATMLEQLVQFALLGKLTPYLRNYNLADASLTFELHEMYNYLISTINDPNIQKVCDLRFRHILAYILQDRIRPDGSVEGPITSELSDVEAMTRNVESAILTRNHSPAWDAEMLRYDPMVLLRRMQVYSSTVLPYSFSFAQFSALVKSAEPSKAKLETIANRMRDFDFSSLISPFLVPDETHTTDGFISTQENQVPLSLLSILYRKLYHQYALSAKEVWCALIQAWDTILKSPDLEAILRRQQVVNNISVARTQQRSNMFFDMIRGDTPKVREVPVVESRLMRHKKPVKTPQITCEMVNKPSIKHRDLIRIIAPETL